MLSIRNALRDRILHLANNVSNFRTDNIEYEMELLMTFLTELSYHEDVTDCLHLCQEAFDLLKTAQTGSCENQAKPDILYTRRRGRPSYSIPEETILFYIENGFTIKQMSSLLSVSEKTVVNRMKEFGLSIRQTYSEINDEYLMEIVKQKVAEFPAVGYRTIKGHLLSEGIRVTERRIRRLMRNVDPLGVLLRNVLCRTYRIRRRSYYVRAPRALWHVDSNHKLIRWRFVIHGGIDGFSRLPMYIKVASDNTAETAFSAFESGVAEFGVPERVRTDKGLENLKIAEFMLRSRGLDRGSHITGRSVHNQRIERFWRELWHGCTSAYYELFLSMEDEEILNVDNEYHLLALHMVYLKRIQKSVDRFISATARRPLRTEQNKTPLQLWIMGQIADPSPEIQPSAEELEFYGVDFENPEPVRDDDLVVVPPLPCIEEDALLEVVNVAEQEVNDPFEVQVYKDVCTYLAATNAT